MPKDDSPAEFSPDSRQEPTPRLELDDEQVRELRRRILANVYNSPLVADAVARRILGAGDL